MVIHMLEPMELTDTDLLLPQLPKLLPQLLTSTHTITPNKYTQLLNHTSTSKLLLNHTSTKKSLPNPMYMKKSLPNPTYMKKSLPNHTYMKKLLLNHTSTKKLLLNHTYTSNQYLPQLPSLPLQ